MDKNIEIMIYLLIGIFGILSGAYIGLSIRKFLLRDKKPKNKKKKTKSVKIQRKEKLKTKKNNGLLSERIESNESFAGFVCDNLGQNSSEFIKNKRKSQDDKYKI